MMIKTIYRETCFSPSSVEKDKAIMDAVVDCLAAKGYQTETLKAEDVTKESLEGADIIVTMARDESLLEMQKALEAEGVKVINTPNGISLCNNRYALYSLFAKNGVPCPPEDGEDGVWVKRGEGCAEVKDDVRFCTSQSEIDAAIESLKSRGITKYLLQAHMKGDLVKFYGVADTEFFTYSYPTDTGHTKFGLEDINGESHHYSFSREALKQTADKAAHISGVLVYGGDAIVREDGSFVIIDFNDWPSFSSCRKDASAAIAELTINIC